MDITELLDELNYRVLAEARTASRRGSGSRSWPTGRASSRPA
jgi:hypothetical protein